MPRSQSKPGCMVVFFAVWITGWSLGTLAFDGVLLWAAYKQTVALGWPTTPGTVLRSYVKTEHDSEGSSHHAIVEYRYVVNGDEHRGDTLRRVKVSTGWKSAHRATQRFPPGKNVDVFYNPRQPAESLLQPGLVYRDAWIALFLLPFNLVMLGSWLTAASYLGRGRSSLPRGIKVKSDFEGFTLRIYNVTPLVAGGAAMLATSFAGVFVNMLLEWLLPGVPWIYLLWLLVLAVAVWTYFWQRRRATLLKINGLRGTFELQRTASGRRAAGTLDELAGVRVVQRTKKDSEGNESASYGVVLDHQPRGDRRHPLLLVHGWPIAGDAERLARWLRDKLNVSESAPPDATAAGKVTKAAK